MKKKVFFVFVLLTCYFRGFSQLYICNLQHWSATTATIVDLDKVLMSFPWGNVVDTVICDSVVSIDRRLKHTWYEDFYNKQFGNYFSHPKHICLAKYHFREKGDTTLSEIHVVKFMLEQKDIDLFKARYGSVSKTAKTYRIKVQTFYKFVVRFDGIYFISTETYQQAKKSHSIFNQLVSYINTDR